MSIAVACACGAKLNVRDNAAGKTVRCPRCSTVLPVPAADAPPAAGGLRVLDDSAAKAPATRAIKCIYCGKLHPANAPACPHCGHKSAKEATGVKLCGSCGAGNPADAPTCTKCGFDLLGASAERYLTMEAHLSAIAMWDRICGVLGGIACILLGVLQGVVLFVAVFMAALFAGLYLLGHFLAKYSNTARIIAVVLQGLWLVGNVIQLMLLMGVIGSDQGGRHRAVAEAGVVGGVVGVLISVAWNVAILWVLFNQQSAAICTPQYQRVVYESPDVKPLTYSSPFFYLPLIGLGIIALRVILAMR